MSGLDYALMALYMLFLVGMGLYYRRFAQESMENYFLGGRKMKGWMSGTSYAVTCMNSDDARLGLAAQRLCRSGSLDRSRAFRADESV